MRATSSRCALCLSLLTLSGAAHAQYTVTYLHPFGVDPGSYSSGVAIRDGQQVGVGSGSSTGFVEHGFLWSGTAASAIDLNPYVGGSSQVVGLEGGKQWGTATRPGFSLPHAHLWSGTAASALDLHPFPSDPTSFSWGMAMGGGQQAGYVQRSIWGVPHAFVWSGTADSAVDLHPAGVYQSVAYGVGGGQQVGGVIASGTELINHAYLWSGSAASGIDLHPFAGDPGSGSFSNGTDGVYQAGSAFGDVTGHVQHAYLWNGTAASGIDLHPFPLDPDPRGRSVANGVFNGYQFGLASGAATGIAPAGMGISYFEEHAYLWHGSAASGIDLHAFVDPKYSYSSALGMDNAGNVVGYAFDEGYNAVALIWSPSASASAPEPSALALVIAGGGALWTVLRRRRR